jgi:sortase A
MNKLILNNSNKAIGEMNSLTEDMISRNQTRDAIYDYDAISDIDLLSVMKESSYDSSKYIVGQIIIKDISLNLPILKGITSSNLSAGAATMREDQHMGEGNYTLAGHYNKNSNILFGGIMHLKKGSIIFITDKRFIYKYRVYDTYVTSDKAINMLSDTKSLEKGSPIITLMTCYYSSKTGKRYFVVGEYLTKYNYDIKLIGL